MSALLRILATVAVVAGLLVTPASAESELACTDHASPHYTDVEYDESVGDWTVREVTLLVDGCHDDRVALQLLTDDDGTFPADGPLVVSAVDGIAVFDFTDDPVPVRPVVGVRVLLLGSPAVEVVVDPDPGDEEPPAVVLDTEPDEQPDADAPDDVTEVLATEPEEAPAALVRTGTAVVALLGSGLLLIAVGSGLLRRRPSRGASGRGSGHSPT